MLRVSFVMFAAMKATDATPVPFGHFPSRADALPPKEENRSAAAKNFSANGPLAALSPLQMRVGAPDEHMHRPRAGLPLAARQQREPRSSIPGLKPEELPLSGYLFNRAIDSRHVDDKDDLKALRVANETVREVRQRLSVGRGNVTTDIERTNHESSHRKLAVEELKGVLGRNQGERLTLTQEAGVVSFAQAGSCGDYAALSAALHADKLEPGELSVYAGDAEEDKHGWAEHLRSMDSSKNVVMDAYATGPAVFRPDNTFTSETKASTTFYGYVAAERGGYRETVEFSRTARRRPHIATYPAGDSVRERVNAMSAYTNVTYGPNFSQHVTALQKSGIQWEGDLWSPVPTLSPDFVERVHEKLENLTSEGLGPKPGSELLQEIVGAYVARSLGDDVATAAKNAPRVVGAGKDLLQEVAALSRNMRSDSDSDSD